MLYKSNLILIDDLHENLVVLYFQCEEALIFDITEHFISDKHMNASRSVDVYTKFGQIA